MPSPKVSDFVSYKTEHQNLEVSGISVLKPKFSTIVVCRLTHFVKVYVHRTD